VTAVLAVEDLRLRYGAVVALAGVTFSVEAGERVGVVGPNGAGKTSLLDCISGVERPSGGRIRLHGRDLLAGRARPDALARLGVARTLQRLGLVDELDVLANLLLGRHHLMRCGLVAGALGLPRSRREEAEHAGHCRGVADDLALAGELRTPVRELPPGARKRVELGRALAMDGSLLLLDEPFAGAPRADVEVMVAAIRRATTRGAAAVVVDHDTATVGALAHRVLTLERGRVAEPEPVP
jgi:branched-chain amino acid transport system ATP-binding protein